MILTVAQLVSQAKHIVVHCPGRKETVARTDALARSLDLAVIKTGLSSTAYLSLAPARATRVGAPLFTIGFPISAVLGSEPKLTEGTVSALSGMGGETSYLPITVPVQRQFLRAAGQCPGPARGHRVDLDRRSSLPPRNRSRASEHQLRGEGGLRPGPLFEEPAPRPAAASRMEAYGAICFVGALGRLTSSLVRKRSSFVGAPRLGPSARSTAYFARALSITPRATRRAGGRPASFISNSGAWCGRGRRSGWPIPTRK
jgi:trypsin-like peptidase